MFFGLIALASYYVLGLIAFNTTHIEMRDDHITISRKPLPNPFDQARRINLDGVAAIRTAETPKSKQEAYDTPRYRVWAEMENGTHQTIVNDVTEDHALFVAQILDERLSQDADMDITHLADDEQVVEGEPDATSILQQSQENV